MAKREIDVRKKGKRFLFLVLQQFKSYLFL